MRVWVRFFLGMLGLLAIAAPAYSAGFAIIEQSVSGLGNAFAGGSAVAQDATTVYFNPAGMTRLKGQEVVLGLHVIMPQARFHDDGSHIADSLGGGALSGGDGGDGGQTALSPNAYYTLSLENGWSFGLGINAPFGLATDYDSGWTGRYYALRSKVETVNINPAVAYKVNEHLSLGAGFNAQYLKAKLSNAVDLGSIAFAQVAGNPATASMANPAWIQGRDGKVDLDADDWSFGYNLGLLYEFTRDTRIGLAYRSRMRHSVSGSADFTLPRTITGIPQVDGAIAAQFADAGVKADITLPDSASLSVFHRINPRWAVMADVTWTNWSTFKELRVKFDPNANGLTLPDNVTSENWKDNWRYSVGATYNPMEKLALRLGLAYDQTPIPDAAHRTPRIPSERRYWVAAGAGYWFTEALGVDVAYAHLFVPDAKVDHQAAGEDLLRGALRGKFENSVDIASLQLDYRF